MTGAPPNAINWTAQQLRLFQRMHKFMVNNQAHFTREGSAPIGVTEWRVISRMAALYAAHNLDGAPSGETRPSDLE